MTGLVLFIALQKVNSLQTCQFLLFSDTYKKLQYAMIIILLSRIFVCLDTLSFSMFIVHYFDRVCFVDLQSVTSVSTFC